jgi:hypothetical protein
VVPPTVATHTNGGNSSIDRIIDRNSQPLQQAGDDNAPPLPRRDDADGCSNNFDDTVLAMVIIHVDGMVYGRRGYRCNLCDDPEASSRH